MFITGLREASHHLFLGSGTGSDTNAARYVSGAFSATGGWQESYLAKSILELGIVGLALIATVFGSILVRGLRIRRRLRDPGLIAMASAILGLMIWGIVYTVKAQYLDFDPLNLYFWLFTGILFKLAVLDREETSPPQRPPETQSSLPSESAGEGPPARVMRALWVFHFPVYGGPHNTAVGVREPLADLGWKTVAALTDEPGNAEQRLTEGGLQTVTMPLHRLRASWHPRDNLRTAAAFRGEVRALEQLIRARSFDLVVLTGLMNPHGAIAARRAGVPVVWQVLDTRTPPVPRSAAMALVSRWADSVMFTGHAVEDLHWEDGRLTSRAFSSPAASICSASAPIRRCGRRPGGVSASRTMRCSWAPSRT